MEGWGITAALEWLRRSKRRTAERLVAVLNARQYEKLGSLITEDLLYLDSMSNPLEGRAAFVSANLQLHRDAPDLTIVLDEFSEAGGVLLVRGRTVSSTPEYCTNSLWEVKFAGDRISHIQVFRDNNAISLPNIARREAG